MTPWAAPPPDSRCDTGLPGGAARGLTDAPRLGRAPKRKTPPGTGADSWVPGVQRPSRPLEGRPMDPTAPPAGCPCADAPCAAGATGRNQTVALAPRRPPGAGAAGTVAWTRVRRSSEFSLRE